MEKLKNESTLDGNKAPLEVVNEMYRAYRESDWEALKATLTDNTVWIYEGSESHPYSGFYEGKEGVMKFFENVDTAVEGLDVGINKIIVDGDTVVSIGFEKQRIRKNNNILEQKWVQIYSVENGLITRMEEYANTAAAEKLFR